MSIQSSFAYTANAVYNTLGNMLIGQYVIADNIYKHDSLLSLAQKDYSMLGDRALFYFTDSLKTYDWTGDSEAANLLSLDRPPQPTVMELICDCKRQCRVTTDSFLSKNAFANEGAFSQFTSVVLSWLVDTKDAYLNTLYNVYIGTTETTTGNQTPTALSLTAGSEGLQISEAMSNLFIDMEDYTRDYNDCGYLRSFNPNEFTVIWNSDYFSKVIKSQAPLVFHDESLKKAFEGHVLPAKYFGSVNTTSGTTAATNTTVRSLIETDYGSTHVIPGQLLPSSTAYAANKTYTVNPKVICKVIKLPPVYMSVHRSEFQNPRSLTTNSYITFVHNTFKYLSGFPFITIKSA